MSNQYYGRDEIIARTGTNDWYEVEGWFGGKTKQEILAECNRVWPQDKNKKLARSIHESLRVGW